LGLAKTSLLTATAGLSLAPLFPLEDGLMVRLICFAVLGGLFVGSVPARAELPTLIPRKVLFGNPVKAAPRISPDGKRLSYLAPDKNDVLQVWVQTIGKDDAKQVTQDKKRGIRIHSWTYAPDTLIYMQDKDGDENFHVHSVNVKDDKVTDLTPFDGVRAMLLGTDKDYPDELLISMNKRDKKVFDVHRLDLKTGEMKLDTQNPGNVIGWNTDNNFRVRIATVPTPDGGRELRYRKDDKEEWKKLLKWGPEDENGSVVGFTKDNKAIHLITSEGRDTLSLVKRDLETGKETLIADNPKADVAGVIAHPDTHEIEAVSFNREKVTWKALDKDMQADLEALRKGATGEPSIASTDKERKTWVVAYSADLTPTTYYLYDRASKKLTKLFTAIPELEKYKLAEMKPVTIKSRDGLELVSYLTLPVGVESKKLPTVLLVHGGPWARDSWGYDPQAQWLANRGYAVLQVNYRGSTGFGKKFVDAGNRQWAAKMHDDLIDAVEWAVKQGYADPKKVAIMGGSYGGYAALVGATFTPDTFACAISIVGPSNLVTLLASVPPYWEPLKKMFALRVGEDEKFLKSRSPLFKADKIKIPMMIGQGKHDPRVKQAESEQIVEAIKKAKKPVEYMLFEDEGHGFVRPENRLHFFAIAENFLAEHLGGRAEPVGKIKGHSAVIR
jgi:dipeptidyl aminopeptidase/acylaminoacyl peptidase